MLRIDATVETPWKAALPEAKKTVLKAAKAAFGAAKTDAFPAKNAEISILLTSDEKVWALNKQYRGMDKPTNVLSFAALDAEDGEPVTDDTVLLGDIVIALETTQREASESNKPLAHHLTHLVIHGVLHLMGFDHMTDDDAVEMETLEIAVLKGLNIENPYADKE